MSGPLRVLMALSVLGMVLLPAFGLLLRFQPKLIHGLHVDANKAEINCYIAAGIYGVVLIISSVTLCYRQRVDARIAMAQRLAAKDLVLGKKVVKGGKTEQELGRHASRTSSREDTSIMLDSSSDTEVTPL